MQLRNNTGSAPDLHGKPVTPTRQISFAVFVIAILMTASAYADIASNLLMPQATHTRPLPPQYRIDADGSVELRLCFNSSCARTEKLTFSAADMEEVEDKLELCPGEVLHDRLQRVRIAVWQMEVLAQKYQPLLAHDLEVNDREFGVDGRMDCVDNASNTTTYLAILTDLGELPSWQVGKSRVRKPFDFNATHWTAVLEDEVTGKEWAIDSWFRPNGHLPYVLPFNAWKAETRGWLAPHDALNPYPHASNELCRK